MQKLVVSIKCGSMLENGMLVSRSKIDELKTRRDECLKHCLLDLAVGVRSLSGLDDEKREILLQ